MIDLLIEQCETPLTDHEPFFVQETLHNAFHLFEEISANVFVLKLETADSMGLIVEILTIFGCATVVVGLDKDVSLDLELVWISRLVLSGCELSLVPFAGESQDLLMRELNGASLSSLRLA